MDTNSEFFNHDMGGAFDTSVTTSGATASEKEGGNNLVHCSLSQILKSTDRDSGLVLYNQKVHFVECIGIAIAIEEFSTKNVYTIVDCTGDCTSIDVQLWKNNPDSAESTTYTPPPLMEHNYMRVVGMARHQDVKPFIVATRVYQVLDPTTIYNHFMAVIHDSMVLEKRMNKLRMSGGALATGDKMEIDRSIADVQDGFTHVQRMVLTMIKNHAKNHNGGMRREEIHKYATGVSKQQVDETLNFLCDESHIFTTDDDDTFLSADNLY